MPSSRADRAQTLRTARLVRLPPMRAMSCNLRLSADLRTISCKSASTCSAPELAEFVGELRQRLEEIGDQAVIGDLEDRRLLVLVDGDDDLGILHAGEMLDGAGDADRDVEVGRDDLAGLADLPVVRRVAGIDRGARGADRGAELVGDRLDVFGEILARSACARPPEMMILAEVSSGRSDFDSSSPTKAGEAGIGRRRDRLDRRPSRRSPAAWKAAVRTVMTFLASVDCTVWTALPA